MTDTATVPDRSQPPLYRTPDAPLQARVDDLISRMTLEQKASQLVDCCAAIPELKIPAYSWWNEALHGIASAGIASVFPQAIGLAATFDTGLMHTVATAIGREGRIKHRIAVREGRGGTPFTGLNFYSPNINIFRDPRWGRGQETYGEDPHLTGAMAVAFIRGMQGEDPRYLQVAATAKHFAAHSGPERGRHGFDAHVSAHDLEDTYLPAFRAAVIDGQVAAVMAAYNSINGVPACASQSLLRRQLRQQWHFDGQIVSDCDGVRHIYEQHHYAASMNEAYAVSIRAGMTSVLDFIHGRDYSPILRAVEQGLLTEAEIDTALRANLRIHFRLGTFDPPDLVPYNRLADELLDSPGHRAIALEAARRSVVLLSNDGVLPLSPSMTRLAVVGPLADNVRVLLGSYHGTPSAVTTVLQGLQRQFPDHHIDYEPGTSFLLDPVTVPAEALSTGQGERGLTVEFFGGTDHGGTALLRQVMPQVVYDGTPATRPAGIPQNAAVCWSGYLTPTHSGDYELGVHGNSNRLFLDGRLLADDTGPHAPRATLVRVRLEAGHRYAIRVENHPGLEQHVRLIWLPIPHDALRRAVDAAQQADVVIAVVGYTAELENEEIKSDVPGFEGGDRLTLGLPPQEQELLEALHTTGKPLVIVLMSGGPISTVWAAEHADAILQCWYPGEEGGTAIAETLAGINNPAARLPVTIYRGIEQLPPFNDYSMEGRTYRYFRGAPLYRFGHGLSYSIFRYSGLTVPITPQVAGATLTVSATVTNASTRPGDEVVQLYVDFPPLAGAPIRALRGFQRVTLQAGETRRVGFTLDAFALSHVDPDGVRAVGPGPYRISIGGSQPGNGAVGVGGTVTMTGWRRLPPDE